MESQTGKITQNSTPARPDLGLGDPGDCKTCQYLQEEMVKNPGGRPPRRLGLIIAAGIGGAGVALSAVCLPFVMPALRRVCLPYVPATDVQLANVMSTLGRWSDKTNSQSSRTLLDIGSGDGRIVLAAANAGYQATGVELNPWLVLYSRWNALRNRRTLSANGGSAKFVRADLWKHSLSKYDRVVVFGVEQMMPELRRKMAAEMRNDALIVACRFQLPGWTPMTEIGSGVDTVWAYTVQHQNRLEKESVKEVTEKSTANKYQLDS